MTDPSYAPWEIHQLEQNFMRAVEVFDDLMRTGNVSSTVQTYGFDSVCGLCKFIELHLLLGYDLTQLENWEKLVGKLGLNPKSLRHFQDQRFTGVVELVIAISQRYGCPLELDYIEFIRKNSS